MKKTIIWNFDGVIIDSLSLRNASIREALSEFSDEFIDQLITQHKKNIGNCSMKKIEYFFTQILKRGITDYELNQYSLKTSNFIKDKLTAELLDDDIMEFIINNHDKIDMHIVSAYSDTELKYVCDKLNITKFFKTITGTQNRHSLKTTTIDSIISIFDYDRENTTFVGDSINDYRAAYNTKVEFCKCNFKAFNIHKSEMVRYKRTSTLLKTDNGVEIKLDDK